MNRVLHVLEAEVERLRAATCNLRHAAGMCFTDEGRAAAGELAVDYALRLRLAELEYHRAGGDISGLLPAPYRPLKKAA